MLAVLLYPRAGDVAGGDPDPADPSVTATSWLWTRFVDAVREDWTGVDQ